ncbi:hypothetical protein [uncultured Pontibacter sp.]|uniref:hypothetical protein n=1 Tax=uncultured Pontibacter sp. TaxID=453356 RepID=UPI00263841D3|nr:hypothetical protein [uncultured Pontibacter sp.]
MNKNLLFYLSLAALLPFSSCQRTEKVKSKEYGVEILTFGLGTKFEAFMYNTEVTVYDRQRFKINNGRLDENTLYILKHHYQDTVEVVDTLKVKLQDSAIDSLYNLTHAYLTTIDMNNEIEEGSQIRENIVDGASFTVSLIYDKKRLEGSQWGLKGAWRASDQAAQLFRFVNRRLPEEFKLY